MRILVIRAGALGDTIFATSIIEPLRSRFGPDVVIDWVARSSASTIFKGDKRIHMVFTLRHTKSPLLFNIDKQKVVMHSLRNRYDYLFNLELGRQFNDLVKWVRAGTKIGAPYQMPAGESKLHAVENLRQVYGEALGAAHLASAYPSLCGSQPEAVRAKYGLAQRYIVVNPTNSHFAKRGGINYRSWPQEHWARLVSLLVPRYEGQIVIVGAKGQESALAGIGVDGDKVRSLVGATTIPELIGLIEGAELLVSTDTGASHIAAATSTRVIVINGPTNYKSTGPYAKDSRLVQILTANLPCSPCYETERVKSCSRNECMYLVTPERVAETALTFG